MADEGLNTQDPATTAFSRLCENSSPLMPTILVAELRGYTFLSHG
jgi:hypothetical protein